VVWAADEFRVDKSASKPGTPVLTCTVTQNSGGGTNGTITLTWTGKL
jgi:hypothetical protein